MVLVFALFTFGYILGVWTACLVFRQPQRAYEDGIPAADVCALARRFSVRVSVAQPNGLSPSSLERKPWLTEF
jgi:hypothetical protein